MNPTKSLLFLIFNLYHRSTVSQQNPARSLEGAAWSRNDGEVLGWSKISTRSGNFKGALDNHDIFGFSVTSVGDLDGDGVGDMAVGAPRDDDGGSDRGAIWILFLFSNGTVKDHQKISDTKGEFLGQLDDGDWLGVSATSLSDLDADGTLDLAVGAAYDDDGGKDRGAVWVLFLRVDGSIKRHAKISDTQGGLSGKLDNDDHFGWSVAGLLDLNEDEVADLAVGAHNDDDGCDSNCGAVWILFLHSNGTVRGDQKIAALTGGFAG